MFRGNIAIRSHDRRQKQAPPYVETSQLVLITTAIVVLFVVGPVRIPCCLHTKYIRDWFVIVTPCRGFTQVGELERRLEAARRRTAKVSVYVVHIPPLLPPTDRYSSTPSHGGAGFFIPEIRKLYRHKLRGRDTQFIAEHTVYASSIVTNYEAEIRDSSQNIQY